MVAPRTARRIEGARARVVAAAHELLRESAWSDLTVADICARADVAPRTFHRYFPDKVELLFSDSAEHEAELRASLERHRLDPAAPRAYLLAVLDDMVDGVEAYGRAEIAWRQELLESSAELAARDLLKRAQLERIAAEALAARLGRGDGADGVRARMLAGMALQAMFVGMTAWAAEGGDLRDRVRGALAAAALG